MVVPTKISMRLTALKAYGGDVGNLWDIEDHRMNNKWHAHVPKKAFKSYRPWRKLSTKQKTMVENIKSLDVSATITL